MNRDPRGFYAALHVAPDATPAQIRRSFRALMRVRHPDVEAASGAAPEDANQVRRILESFAVLRNPTSRAHYDAAATPGGPMKASTNSREIPVRYHRDNLPLVRVTPVRWERGPR